MVVIWGVKTGTLFTASECRADQIKSGTNQLSVQADPCHLPEGHNCDPFIRPAHTVCNRDGCVIGIVPQQGRLNLFDMTRTEIEAEAGPKGRKVVQFL